MPMDTKVHAFGCYVCFGMKFICCALVALLRGYVVSDEPLNGCLSGLQSKAGASSLVAHCRHTYLMTRKWVAGLIGPLVKEVGACHLLSLPFLTLPDIARVSRALLKQAKLLSCLT